MFVACRTVGVLRCRACVLLCVVCVCCVCVCVCERERERERDRERERVRSPACGVDAVLWYLRALLRIGCVCVSEKESVCVCWCVRVCERERM